MKIEKDQSIKEWAFDEIANNWGDDRTGIHMTDLLTPRKRYWQEKIPRKATTEDILIWLPGIELESRLKRALNVETPDSKKFIIADKYDLWYSTDMFFNFPAEIKMRRRQLAEEGKEDSDYEWYLKQLKGYCALENKQQGWLIVYTPIAKVDDSKKTKSDMEFYRVEFTKSELIDEILRINNTYILLLNCLNGGDYSELPPCPEWMCAKEIKTMTKKPHCVECNKDFETEWGINKHVNSKTGKGHSFTKAEFEITHEPRCKWFTECQGG